MSEPIVSVIIPTFNARRFVTEAIDSVLRQTFQSFEIIVVDDGSTDATKDRLAQYGDRIRYFCKRNEGVSTARNYGIARSRGKFIALLDADDLWLPEKLERQMSFFENSEEIGLCYTSAITVDQDLNVLGYNDAIEYEDPCKALLLNMNILILSSAIIRKSILKQAGGFDSNFSTCADKELWLRVSRLTRFCSVNKYLVKYREVVNSMSSNPDVSKRDTLSTLDKFFDQRNLPQKYRKIRRKAYSNNLMIVSGEYWRSYRFFESLSCMFKAVQLYPLNVKRPLGLPVRTLKRIFFK